jgi:branched-chain amino acid transport system ATP-binding protein
VTTLLQVNTLSRHFGGLKAVSDLTFAVKQGEIVGLIGPNGAGKTTAVNVITGVVPPTSGQVLFNGHDVTGLAPHRLAKLGLVRTFQSTAIYGKQTVRENALRGAFLHLYPGFLATLLDTARARQMRAQANLIVDELLDWLDLGNLANRPAEKLPYGYQKLLGLVIALAARPILIMLDEPVAGLSAAETDHVRHTITRIRDRGISMMVIDHNMRFISGLCDRVVVVHHGQELAHGAPGDVLNDVRVIEAYLGNSSAVAHSRSH